MSENDSTFARAASQTFPIKPQFDLTGRKFGKLTVVEFAGRTKAGSYRWRCDCDCGGAAIVVAGNLQSGNTEGCGCLLTRKSGKPHEKHGMTELDEYGVWSFMKLRCSSASKGTDRTNYFERGIRVCERWDSFANFYADMGPRPTSKHQIDRIDTNGNYEPGNCRWATSKQNNRNRRNNTILTCFGESMCISEWADRTGLSQSRISQRIRLGWTIEDALSIPILRAAPGELNKYKFQK